MGARIGTAGLYASGDESRAFKPRTIGRKVGGIPRIGSHQKRELAARELGRPEPQKRVKGNRGLSRIGPWWRKAKINEK